MRPVASEGLLPVRRRGVRRSLALVACLVVTLATGEADAESAATATALEQRVKAASLFRFLNYVEWPAPASGRDAYHLGVIGADDVARELTQLAAGRTVNGKAVNVERLQPSDALNDVDMLYIGLAEGTQLNAALRHVQGQPILVVTSVDGGLRPGSMINFRIADERVRFEVALDALEQVGLRISSRMLAVALQVVRTPGR